jgi:hypothetical protein
LAGIEPKPPAPQEQGMPSLANYQVCPTGTLMLDQDWQWAVVGHECLGHCNFRCYHPSCICLENDTLCQPNIKVQIFDLKEISLKPVKTIFRYDVFACAAAQNHFNPKNVQL